MLYKSAKLLKPAPHSKITWPKRSEIRIINACACLSESLWYTCINSLTHSHKNHKGMRALKTLSAPFPAVYAVRTFCFVHCRSTVINSLFGLGSPKRWGGHLVLTTATEGDK